MIFSFSYLVATPLDGLSEVGIHMMLTKENYKKRDITMYHSALYSLKAK